MLVLASTVNSTSIRVRSQKAVILIQPYGIDLEPLATQGLKIQEALSMSPVRSIPLLQSQASRRSPRIWLPTPLKTEKSTAFWDRTPSITSPFSSTCSMNNRNVGSPVILKSLRAIVGLLVRKNGGITCSEILYDWIL